MTWGTTVNGATDSASETWSQMEARHAIERAELMARIKIGAYSMGRKGMQIPKEKSMRNIAAQVAEKYKLTVGELRSPERRKFVARCRFEAFKQCRDAGFTLPQIGGFFGRDHTTVLSGIRRYEELTASHKMPLDMGDMQKMRADK